MATKKTPAKKTAKKVHHRTGVAPAIKGQKTLPKYSDGVLTKRTKEILKAQAKRTSIMEPALLNTRPQVSLRRHKFVQSIAAGVKIGQAAKDAGFSPKSAAALGSGLLKVPEIIAEIQEVKTSTAAKLGITAERILKEYAALGFSNMLDYTKVYEDTGEVYINLADLTRDQAAAIQEITVEEYVERKPGTEDEYERVKRTKFKLHPKEVALDKMARHIGLKGFGTKKVELTGKDGGAIQVTGAISHMTDEQLELIAEGKDPTLELDLPEGQQLEGEV